MLYKWNRKDPNDVDSLLQNASDDRVDYDYWCEAGIGHRDCVPLAKTLGFTWGAGGKLTMPLIVKTLKKSGPIIAVGQWNNPRGAHAIVVCSAMDIDDESDESGYLKIANPWFGSDERETRSLSWFNGGLGDWEGVNGQYIHW